MPEAVAITDPVLDRITRTIVERFHSERVLLFGSRARGDARADSDYDVMVIMDPDPYGASQVAAIHAAFEQPRTWSMDVVVRTPAEAARKREDVGTLVYAAEHEGRLLYARPGSERPAGADRGDRTASRVREKRRRPPESLAGGNTVVADACRKLSALCPSMRYPEAPEPSGAEATEVVHRARALRAEIVARIERLK